MEVTQSFRLVGETDIEQIPCDLVDGQYVVHWMDIEHVFPKVKYVKNGNVAVNLMKDSNRNRIVPHCIKYYPDVILDVALSSTVRSGLAESQVIPPFADVAINHGGASTLNPCPTVNTFSNVVLSFNQTSNLSRREDLDSEMERRLFSSLAPEIQEQHCVNSDVYIMDGRCFQGFKAEMTKNIELTKQLKDQAFRQFVLLSKQVQAILTQNLELYNNHIPRLFIVLPQDSSQWDYTNPSSNSFRFYFLCECEEYTKSTPNKSLQHHIHLAKHKGYDIAQPSEFFQQYGFYILTILRMLKFGISVPGVTIPPVSQLSIYDRDRANSSVQQHLADTIEAGIDQVIGYIEDISVDDGRPIDESTEGMRNNEIFKGAADLRNLKTFLKDVDGNTLGDLYRTVDTQGHVKWICIDHYREKYPETEVEALNDIALPALWFNEDVGEVSMSLYSRGEADHFYSALAKAKFVYQLWIDFLFNATYDDYMALRDSIYKTNVAVLELLGYGGNGPTSDNMNHNRRHNPIFDIMRHPTIQSIEISCMPDLFSQSKGISRHSDFSNLRHLGIDEIKAADISKFESLLAKAPNLSSLALYTSWKQFLAVYGAIVKHQTFLIDFKCLSLRILPPTTESRQSRIALRDLAHLFRVHGGQIEKFGLGEEGPDDLVVETFAEATQDVSKLKEFSLMRVNRRLGYKCIRALASIVSQAELRELDIDLEDEEGRVRILEAIQWKHLRKLTLTLEEDEGHVVVLMKVLVDSVKALERGCLEEFTLNFCGIISSNELFRSFVSSRSLKQLRLHATMTTEQALQLIASTDLSRLQLISLRLSDGGTDKVQTILDSLRNTTELQNIGLVDAYVTCEQVEQMKARGITLERYLMVFE